MRNLELIIIVIMIITTNVPTYNMEHPLQCRSSLCLRSDYLAIVASVLQGDTLALYLFIICLDYVLRTSIDKIKEDGFKLTKERSIRYPPKQLPMLTTPLT